MSDVKLLLKALTEHLTDAELLEISVKNRIIAEIIQDGWVPVVRCKDCQYCFVDGENVRFNVCELNHNIMQADDWFCADGVRREDDGIPE